MKISVQVVPEGGSSYYISWNDTVGQSKGYEFRNRPLEVWCLLKDTKDTVAYYKGVSTPTNFIYFSTSDTVILATFMIGPNIFSHLNLKEESDGFKTEVIEFNPINLNIKSDLRKSIQIVLTQKTNKRNISLGQKPRSKIIH